MANDNSNDNVASKLACSSCADCDPVQTCEQDKEQDKEQAAVYLYM